MRRFLLDSHVVLWWLDGADRLSERAVSAISDGDNEIVVSVASIYELSIKESLHKLTINGDLRQHLQEQWFQELPVSGIHAVEAGRLPWHHKDPFDRLIVAQARCEGLTLVTSDHILRQYDVQTLPAN
jgi:PIN domain nuclease of toxin-antitoxin system